MLRPVAGVCNVAKEQRRNNAQTNTEIRYCKNNERVGFSTEISSATDEEDCKSISNDGQEWKNPAKNPKPAGLHS